MPEAFDQYDLGILRILQSEGRVTNVELSKRIGLSPPSTLQRVRNLEEAGIIQGYEAVLSAQKLGFNITVWAMISLSLHQGQPIDRFRKSIAQIREVVECYHVSGEFDFLLKILVKDIPSYEELIRLKISQIKGIQQIKSSFVLSTPKTESRVPL